MTQALYAHMNNKREKKKKAAYRIGENLCQLLIRQGINIQNLQGSQKPQPPKNQHPNVEMGT
jgi:glycine cleavage system regulatory protein